MRRAEGPFTVRPCMSVIEFLRGNQSATGSVCGRQPYTWGTYGVPLVWRVLVTRSFFRFVGYRFFGTLSDGIAGQFFDLTLEENLWITHLELFFFFNRVCIKSEVVHVVNLKLLHSNLPYLGRCLTTEVLRQRNSNVDANYQKFAVICEW